MGIIAAPEGPTIFDRTGKLAFTSAVEAVGVWNLRQASQVCSLQYDNPGYPYSDRGEVSSLALAADHTTVCVGYTTGEVRLFNYVDKTLITTLRGHRSTVSSMSLKSPDHTVLASGSADCNIVLWDLVARSGIGRLRGHKDMVTAVSFLGTDYLVSASKDTLLKVWDTLAMTCVQTVVGHRSEVWSLAVVPAEDRSMVRVFTGASDDLLRVYTLNAEEVPAEGGDVEILHYLGSVKRSTSERCTSLALNHSNTLIAAQAAGKTVDFLRLLDKATAKKRSKRRAKRAAEGVQAEDGTTQPIVAAAVSLEDELEFVSTLKCAGKIRSFAFAPSGTSSAEDVALVSMANNSLELYKVQASGAANTPIATKTSIIELPGHRSDVRGICISADDVSIATCSAETVKIWSMRSGQCIGSCHTDQYALCLAFAPGGRFLLVGTKSGALEVLDVASGESVQTIADAHAGAIWSICVRPDSTGFSTASADKLVKLWSFEIAAEGLRIAYDRQLLTPSDILCVRYNHAKTANHMMFATAQLDHNIRIFFQDSLKLYLTLYGHKLPVLSLDISYDNTLLVSGSADKTIKIWGMDFGDCHKSLFAHDDSVTAVRFVNHTHYFFSSGKDGAVKYWDADRFEQILYLPGHKGSVWGLEVATDGSSAFSVGADRSVRMWSRSEDLVFVEEEKERMLDAQVDKTAAEMAIDTAEQVSMSTTTTTAAIASVESIRSGDQLMQAVDNIEAELGDFLGAMLADADSGSIVTVLHQPSKAVLMLGLSPLRYLLRALRMIKQPDLEAVLLALPFHYVQRLVVLLVQLAKSGLEVELSCRCSIFLLLSHQGQIASSTLLAPAILALRDVVVHTMGAYRFMVGVNLAGLQHMQQQLEEQSQDMQAQRTLYGGEDDKRSKSNKKRRKAD